MSNAGREMDERERKGSAGDGDPRPGVGGWLARAAVFVLVLIGVVSLVPSLRLRLFDAGPGEPESEEVVEEAEQGGDTTALDLLPAPDTLRYDTVEVRFSTFQFELIAEQRYGVVRVRLEDRPAGFVEIRTRTGLERFIRIPTGMRVLNQPGSVADYEIVLPNTVRRVRVTMNGRELAAYGTAVPENQDRTFTLADYAR